VISGFLFDARDWYNKAAAGPIHARHLILQALLDVTELPILSRSGSDAPPDTYSAEIFDQEGS
jgi:hypothetical protein